MKKLEDFLRQARSSKQTSRACVNDTTIYSFVLKCEKLENVDISISDIKNAIL